MIEVKVTGLEQIEALSQKISNADQALMGIAMQFTLILKTTIEKNLKPVLGNKAKYFEVNTIPTGREFILQVHAVDEIGGYIYTGTVAHIIEASDSGALKFGQGYFAKSVYHPGTPSHKEEIEQAIMASVYEARSVIGDIGGRIFR